MMGWVSIRVVGSAYRVGELLGRGAMGEVYAAVGPGGQEVALKFLHPAFAEVPDLVSRFRREARIAGRISSPYVARVLGAGRDREGLLWIAFERLRGETLEATLRRVRRMPFGDVAWVVEHVLAGLKAAHAEGIVHRDIKPANVFLDAGGRRARILDFGVSKLHDTRHVTEAGVTTTHQFVGTPLFAAPEQLDAAAETDARADLYAVGLVAFAALTGRLPYAGESAEAMMHHKRYFAPRTLAEASGFAWPEDIERHLGRALAPDPVNRHADAEGALADWKRACEAARASGWNAPEDAAPPPSWVGGGATRPRSG
jgi:serine/threonine-protein kinase